MRCQAWHSNSEPVVFDTRRALQAASARLTDAGYAMTCELEVEFYIHKIRGDCANHQLDPMQAS